MTWAILASEQKNQIDTIVTLVQQVVHCRERPPHIVEFRGRIVVASAITQQIYDLLGVTKLVDREAKVSKPLNFLGLDETILYMIYYIAQLDKLAELSTGAKTILDEAVRKKYTSLLTDLHQALGRVTALI